ncbi:MAG: hypothetical protein KC493_00510 [Bacteriovoracaceae bacterium]|nr:hypothetical protein [Bacteriovoracaceae bacterium]
MKKLLLVTLFSFSFFSFAQNSGKPTSKTIEEKEGELVDFKSIQGVLKEDMLTQEVKKKVSRIQNIKKKRKKRDLQKYLIPGEDEIWSFLSELWLVKSAPVLKWDFQKPEYGIEESFKELLEEMGHYEIDVKVILVNTPVVTHMALPSSKGEYIFVLSVPFMRTLDLSKMEISILLFEDFMRVRKGYFANFVKPASFGSVAGSNFKGEKFPNALFKTILKKYDDIIFDRGFTFQQQFEITKDLNRLFKSNMKYWNIYYTLLKKIDELTKTNLLYNGYVKIFPSPELQLNWLRPKKEVL